MCACYLIYYHDIAPWDAIRIMRRQRPGSVERKVQEETVVKFFTLVNVFFSLTSKTRGKQLFSSAGHIGPLDVQHGPNLSQICQFKANQLAFSGWMWPASRMLPLLFKTI